jgi:hypothetical protein
LVAGLPRWSEESNDDAVSILKLAGELVESDSDMKGWVAYKDVGAVGAWSPSVGGTIWTVENAATLKDKKSSQ